MAKIKSTLKTVASLSGGVDIWNTGEAYLNSTLTMGAASGQ